MNQHLLVKIHQLCVAKIGALIWCIFPAQLDNSELIRGSLSCTWIGGLTAQLW